MLKQRAVFFVKPFQRRRAIARAAGKEDQVMRPCHGVDAVELYKAQIMDHLEQRRALGRTLWRIRQQMPRQKQPPRGAIAERRAAHP